MSRPTRLRAWDYLNSNLSRLGLLYHLPVQGFELTEDQRRLQKALNDLDRRPLTIEQLEALNTVLESVVAITVDRARQ